MEFGLLQGYGICAGQETLFGYHEFMSLSCSKGTETETEKIKNSDKLAKIINQLVTNVKK